MKTFQVPQTREEVFNDIASSVKAELPKSNPWKLLSWIRAILIGISGKVFDYYQDLLLMIDAVMDDTTYGDYLIRKAKIYDLQINAATPSNGKVIFIGTASTFISAETSIVSLTGKNYKTQEDATTEALTLDISSLLYNSGVATAIFEDEHNLGTGMTITIAGATPTELNGEKVITVIDKNTVSFSTLTSGTGTATGTISASVVMATVNVLSDDTGVDTKLVCGDTLTLASAIVGINNKVFIGVDGISGGANQESEDHFRERYIYRKQHPVTNFNEAAIVVAAKKNTVVDRAWVQRVTPAVGQVTVYFLKLNNEIPTDAEKALVKQSIYSISPANTGFNDIFVNSPTPVPINIQISLLSPLTSTMKQAIINSLTVFFNTKTEVGITITRNELIAVIQTSIDLLTGDTVISFNLDIPTADTEITSTQIATLGAIEFV